MPARWGRFGMRKKKETEEKVAILDSVLDVIDLIATVIMEVFD